MLAFTDKRSYLSDSIQLNVRQLGDDIRAHAEKAQRAIAALSGPTDE